jgi:flavodoxin
MGLDNIPNAYPCKKANTAILVDDGRIDCDATKNSGGCPWKNEFESSILLKEASPTYGMFGTSCWYRGKYGNSLLNLSENGEFDPWGNTRYSFYGEGLDDGEEGMSPEYCKKMSKYMRDKTEHFAATIRDYAKNHPEEEIKEKEIINDWIYAAWWLDFIAEYGDGSQIWY